MAKVILLNGVSSAGKSTLARSIQSLADRTFLHVAMDDFIAMLPNGREIEPDWFPVVETAIGGSILPSIADGPRGEELLRAMRAFVGDLAGRGIDVIVDDVCDAEAVADYHRLMRGSMLFVVKVIASIDIIEQRERERGDRLVGLARAQACRLHEGIAYELEVDTGSRSPSENAQKILDYVGR